MDTLIEVNNVESKNIEASYNDLNSYLHTNGPELPLYSGTQQFSEEGSQ